MKILNNPEKNVFLVSTSDEQKFKSDYKGVSVIVAHDYVQFMATTLMNTDGNVKLLNSDEKVCENCVSVLQQVQIPIRAFKDVILPYLEKSENLTDEHVGHNYDYHHEEVHEFSSDGEKHVVRPAGWTRFATLTDDEYKSYKEKTRAKRDSMPYSEWDSTKNANRKLVNEMSDEVFYESVPRLMESGVVF